MELGKGNDVEIGFEENQRRLSVMGGRCVEIMLPNPTSGVGVGGGTGEVLPLPPGKSPQTEVSGNERKVLFNGKFLPKISS